MTKSFKFDVVIGNPPYQEENKGDNRQAEQIYHLFMQEAYKLSDKVTFITPARFLFNPSKALEKFSKKMLQDSHFKISYYEQNSNKVFPNTDIKGGVVVSYRDEKVDFGPILVFTSFQELNDILHKVIDTTEKFKSINTLIYSTETYKLTDVVFEEYPQLIGRTDMAHQKTMASSVFTRYPEIFYDTVESMEEYIKIFGKENNKRVYKYIRQKYVNNPENLQKFKIFVPGANGSGAIGEVLSTPLIGEPFIGHTQTFISFGAFNTKGEAENLLKYIKTKFARVMLGIKKVTQNNQSKATWEYVPLQDFTPDSDIDWSQSIPEIDQQLYKKYGLSQEEINFIEEKVKAME
ncbi:Eco57I restriction-modification methylase domain-containing protein [Streptococcus sp. H49]|uniref:Eco57I restriction-modification methylase domain-containing protein n=1 Tax=Streptococcus huangxiaojuni TaxID=3237239 RepID=UPI0034A4687A